jgi:myosin heavy subunit
MWSSAKTRKELRRERFVHAGKMNLSTEEWERVMKDSLEDDDSYDSSVLRKGSGKKNNSYRNAQYSRSGRGTRSRARSGKESKQREADSTIVFWPDPESDSVAALADHDDEHDDEHDGEDDGEEENEISQSIAITVNDISVNGTQNKSKSKSKSHSHSASISKTTAATATAAVQDYDQRAIDAAQSAAYARAQMLERNYRQLSKFCQTQQSRIGELEQQVQHASSIANDISVARDSEHEARQELQRALSKQGSMAGEMKKLRDKVSSIGTIKAQHQSFVTELRAANTTLVSQVDQLHSKIQALEHERDQLQSTVIHQAQREQAMQHEKRLGDMEHQMKQYQQQIAKLEQDVQEAQLQRTKSENKYHHATLLQESSDAEMRRMRNNLSHQEQASRKLHKQLNLSRDVHKRVEIDMQDLRVKLKTSQRKVSELNEKVQWSESARQTLQKQFDALWSSSQRNNHEAESKESAESVDPNPATATAATVADAEQVAELRKEIGEMKSKYSELEQVLATNAARDAANRNTHQKWQVEYKNCLAKLVQAEEASESSLTCLLCTQTFTHPVTCTTCGISYCKHCSEESHGCKACGKQEAEFVANMLLEDLASKQQFKLQAILALEQLAAAPLSPDQIVSAATATVTVTDVQQHI